VDVRRIDPTRSSPTTRSSGHFKLPLGALLLMPNLLGFVAGVPAPRAPQHLNESMTSKTLKVRWKPSIAPTAPTTPQPVVTSTAPAVILPSAPPPSVALAPSGTPDAASWASSAAVACIRQAESGNDYGIDTGNGYYGAYQDSLSTWEDAGGSGLPNDASPAVQDQINYQIWLSGGWGQWSTSAGCGV
jgi:Transglycosylase-like domain